MICIFDSAHIYVHLTHPSAATAKDQKPPRKRVTDVGGGDSKIGTYNEWVANERKGRQINIHVHAEREERVDSREKGDDIGEEFLVAVAVTACGACCMSKSQAEAGGGVEAKAEDQEK
ncbi:hypothetical protein Trydic_g20471 [Trypoxylus dichotomus]